ncbi:unnamed protein product [Cylicocyclus nassatus]|uniref:SCP domain-containing protein n=1 Tax=Cylicocyclus nassatus TaxID=53992 RepID=A0AA36H1S0_CYLNA|nr:unnamed protein product [Cylicocyclus nassatus]
MQDFGALLATLSAEKRTYTRTYKRTKRVAGQGITGIPSPLKVVRYIMLSYSAATQNYPGILPTGENTKCPKNVGMKDNLRTKFLDMHNYRRGLLAQGQVQKNTGNLLPTGANILKMEYDCTLEKKAIEEVRNCPTSKKGYGKNFITVSINGLTWLEGVNQVVTSWWKVVRQYPGPGMEVTFRQNHVNQPIESFTQMGWATSKKLGCAIAKCSNHYTAICNYDPRGNYVEQVIYQKGSPCKACPTQCDGQGGVIEASDTAAVITSLTNTRTELTKGTLMDKAGKNLPAADASKMQTITWDCGLETTAIAALPDVSPCTLTAVAGKAVLYAQGPNGLEDTMNGWLKSAQVTSAYKQGTTNYEDNNDKSWEIFANLMQAGITKIGCAVCNGGTGTYDVYCITDQTGILAQGQVHKNTGNLLPTGANILKMEYDCTLEKKAIEEVRNCPTSKKGYGKNFITVSIDGLSWLEGVNKVVTSWWKVVRHYPGPGMEVTFRQNHVNQPIESFTQMAWATSRKLGCAIAKCSNHYTAICNYDPRGNYVEQLIYQKGTPCKACPSGWKCESTSKLCMP